MAGPRPRHLSPLVTRERNPRIDTEVGRSVVALSWPPFVSISQAKGERGGGGVGKWKKKARHPDGAEGPSRNREQGDERGWGGGS